MIIWIFLVIFILSILLSFQKSKESYNNNGKIRVYCINRLQRKDRKERFLDKMRKSKIYNNLDIEIIDAVDRDNLDEKLFNKKLKGGEIGCYLSHLEALMKLLSTGKEINYAMIFEDDAVCEEEIEKILREKRYRNYDLFILGHNYQNSKECKADICEDMNVVHGAHAYLINKKGANKLLSKAFPISKPYDLFYVDEEVTQELKIGLLKKSICGVYNLNDTNTQ